MIISTNAIWNNPVTFNDINLAKQIFGPDIGTLKGKITRTTPTPIVNDYIEIPTELTNMHEDIELCINTMCVNGLTFLTTVSQHLQYCTTIYIPNQSAKTYWHTLKDVFCIYNAAGFLQITKLHANNEFNILKTWLNTLENIHLNLANVQVHVPEAECHNCTIKECICATFHHLPFLATTKTLTQILVMEVAKQLNYFSPKGGISQIYSPLMILHWESLDYNCHCTTPFGTYVQAVNDPIKEMTNNLEPLIVCFSNHPLATKQDMNSSYQ